jgi:non-heme chloroperoxidase
MQQAVPPPRFATARLATGLRVHYTEQGDPGGEPILFLPAYADSWFSYSRVLALLPARYHAYAFDQRGHGESERPACCYGIDDFAADAVAFLDAVGLQRAALVGHSGSCFAARRVAVTNPERVARLVLSGSPAGSLPQQVAVGLQATVGALADPVPVDFVRQFQAGAAHVPLPETFLERLVAESRKLPARVWRDAADGLVAFDDTADLERITAPTLLVWGDRDGLQPTLGAPRAVRRRPGRLPASRLTDRQVTAMCPGAPGRRRGKLSNVLLLDNNRSFVA